MRGDNKYTDPLTLLSEEEKKRMGERISQMSAQETMELKRHANIIREKYRTYATKQSPTSVTVFENATVTKVDILSAKNSVSGINNIARSADERGRKEARTLLEKFTEQTYGEAPPESTGGLSSLQESVGDLVSNPLKPFSEYDEFEESKPLSVQMAEEVAEGQEQYERLQDRVGTTQPDPKNKSILDPDEGYLSNFKDKEAAMQLLKDCIPCEFRKLEFGADFGTPWASTLDDLKKKWKELQNQLRALTTFNPGEFSGDLCNLLKFLDGQCIPDIAGLVSLLSLMQIKYLDLSGTSLNNLINQLIAPFLTPIVGSFTSNLDKYVDLIIGPLKCVTAALENQVVELQDQISGAYNIADMNTAKFRKKEIDFFDAKMKAIRNVKIREEKDAQQKIAQAKTEEERKEIKGNLGRRLEGIDQELDKINTKKQALVSKMRQESPYSPAQFDGATDITRESRYALDNYERAFKSIIGDLTDALNDGMNLVKQSVDTYREEFQRLVLGRISTQQDQVEYTRLLQKIVRLKSIVDTVDQFKKSGKDLRKLCSQGSGNALAKIAQGIKENDSQGMFDFYQAQDNEGNPLIVVAPGGAKLTVSSVEFENVEDDALFGDASFDLDSVTKTVSFNDLNEVDKLNREGVVPDLGNIDSKKIELSDGSRPGSEMDLHFKSSYAIISNEFCNKSAISFGSSDTVKKWADNLWQRK